MTIETLAYVYTTEEEIQRLFSTEGADFRIDDLSAGDQTTYLTDLIGDVTTTIDFYAAMMYHPADLASSRWVRSRATWIACYYLSQRRGNPAQFLLRYTEIIAELERVQAGQPIPNLPTRDDMTPAMSNVIVDNRYLVDRLRVLDTISTGGSDSRQSLFPSLFYDWY